MSAGRCGRGDGRAPREAAAGDALWAVGSELWAAGSVRCALGATRARCSRAGRAARGARRSSACASAAAFGKLGGFFLFFPPPPSRDAALRFPVPTLPLLALHTRSVCFRAFLSHLTGPGMVRSIIEFFAVVPRSFETFLRVFFQTIYANPRTTFTTSTSPGSRSETWRRGRCCLKSPSRLLQVCGAACRAAGLCTASSELCWGALMDESFPEHGAEFPFNGKLPSYAIKM